MDIKALLEQNRKALGADADLSYINEEELEKASRLDAINIPDGGAGTYDGNSLMQYSDGHWEWYERCDTKVRYKSGAVTSSKRIVNCANGLVHYEIRTSA